jgi:tetratricopeptide (TPR) repeat protein
MFGYTGAGLILMKISLNTWLPATTALVLFFCGANTVAQQDVGEVAFANSGAPAAQVDFLRGLAQLHNFEYDDAAEHFRKAEQVDPDFAMAFWGEAMTENHPVWHEQDLVTARQILARLGATSEARLAKAPTQREKLYLHSVEILYGDGTKEERDQKYELAMGELHQRFPNDVDGASFYALAILGSAEQGRDFATYMRAAAVLEEIFPEHPRHPGVVHYLIHCYDDPIHAPLGLRAARIYSKVAPDAGHAQHMTSHIFLALGMWDDVVKANETAMGVVNQLRQKAGKPPLKCGHYNEWLEYGYMQQGRVVDARRVLEACRQEANQKAAAVSRDKSVGKDMMPTIMAVGSYADMRVNFLIDSQLWDGDVARWTLPAGDYPLAEVTFDYADALAAILRGDLASAREAALRSEDDRQRALAWSKEQKLDDPQEGERLLILNEQVHALVPPVEGKSQDTVAELQRTAAKEHAMPLEFGPPSVYKPTDELLGEVLLQQHRPSDARDAFQAALARAPGRRLSVAGLARAEKEKTDASAKTGNHNANTVDERKH